MSGADQTAALTGADASARSESDTLGGRYVLGRYLGHGGVADVYEARDAVLDRTVAIKVFRHHSGVQGEADRRKREISLLASLNHPHLVSVYDAGSEREDTFAARTYLVMELVDGGCLRDAIARGPMAPDVVRTVGIQMAEALTYVHERGIVHRDVKPANILLAGPADRCTVKLADFGIASLLDAARLTTTGTTIGTANYLSPEQVGGGNVSGASDVYSLGLVLLECLTGTVTYPGHGVEAAVARLRRAPEIPATLSQSWRDLLIAMTSQEPANRPTGAEVADRLRTMDATRVLPVPENAPETADGTAPFWVTPARTELGTTTVISTTVRRPARRVVLGVILLLILALAVIIAASSRGGGSKPPTYPAVPGQIGTDLKSLQGAVG